MVEIRLDDAEAALVRELLDGALRDLSHEIADTDRSTFRDQLKRRRALLAGVLERLGGPLPDPGAD